MELLIGDDGDAPASIPDDPSIRYVRLDRTSQIGAKRNLLCELARGAVIVHWDDDDWSAPNRIEQQVELLRSTSADLTGYRCCIFYRDDTRTISLYNGLGNYAVGTSLCYWLGLWQRNKFPDLQVGEDNDFVRRALLSGRVHFVDGVGMMVARKHFASTDKSRMQGSNWRPIGWEEFPREAQEWI